MKSTFSDSPGNHNRWFRPHFSRFYATRLGRFINESRYGGILYLALWLVVLGLVFTLFQTIFLSIAYTGRLTPDDYEVLHVEQTEYDQSIGAYDSGIIRRFSDYLVTVQYEVDGTRYTADLSLGQAFFTGPVDMHHTVKRRLPRLDGQPRRIDSAALIVRPGYFSILIFSHFQPANMSAGRIPMILPHRSARFYSRRIMAPSPRFPITAEISL